MAQEPCLTDMTVWGGGCGVVGLCRCGVVGTLFTLCLALVWL